MKHNLKNILFVLGMLGSTNTYFVMGTSPEFPDNELLHSDAAQVEMLELHAGSAHDQHYGDLHVEIAQLPEDSDAAVDELAQDLGHTHLSDWREKSCAYALCGKCVAMGGVCVALGAVLLFTLWDPALITQGGQACATAVGEWCDVAVKKIASDTWYKLSELGPLCIPFLKMLNDPKGVCHENGSLYQWAICRKEGCQYAPQLLCRDLSYSFGYDFSALMHVKLHIERYGSEILYYSPFKSEHPGNATGSNVTSLAEILPPNATLVKFVKVPRRS
jgi:hypothetical protein